MIDSPLAGSVGDFWLEEGGLMITQHHRNHSFVDIDFVSPPSLQCDWIVDVSDLIPAVVKL